MARSILIGTRIRERRILLGLKQSDLARTAEISPSYLNLIEHNRRRIGGKLLGRIAEALGSEVSALTRGAETETLERLEDAAAAHAEVPAERERMEDFLARFPGWAALVCTQRDRIAALEGQVAGLVDRLAHDPYLQAALHELLSKVAAIRSTATILTETDDLDEIWRARFHRNLAADSQKLSEGAALLARYLSTETADEPVPAGPREELERFLDARAFHVAELEEAAADPDRGEARIEAILATAPGLRSTGGIGLARAHLRRYVEDAARMPLASFSGAAEACGGEPVLLARRFGVDASAVLRRLASLPADTPSRRTGFVSCDGSGALLLRKPCRLLPLPRFGAACALWPLFRALARPAEPVRAVLEHPGQPGLRFVAYAICERSLPQGVSGPAVLDAMMILLPPGLADPDSVPAPTERVGTSCRLCPVAGCPARREPSVLGETLDSGARASQ